MVFYKFCDDSFNGASIVKWIRKVLRYLKAMGFWITNLKVVAV